MNTKNKIFAIAMVVALSISALAVPAASSDPDVRPLPPPPLPRFKQINETNNGDTVYLYVGELLMLHLKTNPSTGYHWDNLEYDTSILNLTNHHVITNPNGGVGAASDEYWIFSAKTEGNTSISLEYVKPGTPPDVSIEYNVDIIVVPGQPAPVSFEISMDGSFVSGEPVTVTATLTNLVFYSVIVSDLSFSLKTLDFEILTPDGKTFHFREQPTTTTTTTLRPGKSKSVSINLASHYDLSQPGEYQIRARYISNVPFEPINGEPVNSLSAGVNIIEPWSGILYYPPSGYLTFNIVHGVDPVLSYSPTEYDFGEVPRTVVSTTVDVWNSGGGTLSFSINKPLADSTYFSITPVSGNLGGGEHCSVNIAIDTRYLTIGEHEYYLHINSNNGSGEIVIRLNVTMQMMLFRLTYPNGGEIFEPGDYCNITWEHYIPYVVPTALDDYSPILIDFYLDIDLYKGGQKYLDIADNVDITLDEYDWVIPDNVESGTDYKIKLTLVAEGPKPIVYFDFSDDYFSILKRVELTLDTDPFGFALDVFKLDPEPVAVLTPTDGRPHVVYYMGSDVTVQVDDEHDGYRFDHWSGDVTGDINPLQVTLNSDKNIVACFVPINGFEIQLYDGWNLITIPVEHYYTAATLAENISGCTTIARWNQSKEGFDSYIPGTSPPEDDFDIEFGVGYFVNVNSDTTFVVEGDPLSGVDVELHEGVNLLGWYQDVNTTASSVMSSVEDCTNVSIWDAVNQKWLSYEDSLDSDFTITKGMGYLVIIEQSQTPSISFISDDVADTLTVASVSPSGISWDNVSIECYNYT
ncbi:MAG: hypothetical protein DRN01_04260, partial [Thermoplasmata archaeon]